MKQIFLAFFTFIFLIGTAAAEPLQMAPGETRTIKLEAPYKSSSNTDKNVAFTTGRGSNTVVIHAKRAGDSEIQLKNAKGEQIAAYEVSVANDYAAIPDSQLNSLAPAAGKGKKSRKAAATASAGELPETRRALRTLFPNETIEATRVERSIVLSGTVSDAETASRAVSLVEQVTQGQFDGVVNMLKVRGGQQVMLRVQIGEVQRGALKDLGLSVQGVKGAITSLFYSNKMYDTSTKLDHLTRNGLMKILAEPNLTAISGEEARFLAGGEFPITVPQKGEDVFTVQYKPFGVGVKFTPFVLADDRIRLEVEPEVSEVSGTSGDLPIMSTRRAKTTVELAPGESFMIAGLIRDENRNVVDEMPALADIPVLGALFRSTAFKNSQSELVIAVTPYLVDPVRAQDIKLPTDNFKPASSLEQYFFGALGSMNGTKLWEGDAKTAPQGQHGFMTH